MSCSDLTVTVGDDILVCPFKRAMEDFKRHESNRFTTAGIVFGADPTMAREVKLTITVTRIVPVVVHVLDAVSGIAVPERLLVRALTTIRKCPCDANHR